MDNFRGPEPVLEHEGALRALTDDSDVVQGLVACWALCSWTGKHEHVLVDGAEIAVDSHTEEVLEVRHLSTPF